MLFQTVTTYSPADEKPYSLVFDELLQEDLYPSASGISRRELAPKRGSHSRQPAASPSWRVASRVHSPSLASLVIWASNSLRPDPLGPRFGTGATGTTTSWSRAVSERGCSQPRWLACYLGLKSSRPDHFGRGRAGLGYIWREVWASGSCAAVAPALDHAGLVAWLSGPTCLR